MIMNPRSTVLLILLSALVATRAPAQEFPAGWTPTASDCQKAADSLVAGARDPADWGFISMSQCVTNGPAAIATAIRNAGVRSVTDTLYFANLLTVAGSVQDMSVLTEAMSLAENKAAPLAARLFALMVMQAQHRPASDLTGGGGWAGLLADRPGSYCRTGAIVHTQYSFTTSMAADFKQRIAASADRIASDATDRAVMRHLARCMRLTLRRAVPEVVPPELLQFEYLCGTRFTATNSSPKGARLRYEVEGTSEAGDLIVKASGSALLITEKTGTVRFLQNGVLVASVANGGTTCP
jgi:hypothetical protein